MPGSFFDTNVLVYLTSADAVKADRAEKLVEGGGAISIQVLNEFANVARRKMSLSWADTHAFLSMVRGLLRVHAMTIESHDMVLTLAERYRLSIYDAMIVAAALDAGCDRLWSEDMQNGMVIERSLCIVDPFIGIC
jgi:predicted nucleic acid-binding protein